MSTTELPYSDINPSNFTVASPLTGLQYSIIYESIVDRKLREVQVSGRDPKEPQTISDSVGYVHGGALASAYGNNERALFYLGNGISGDLYIQRHNGKWQPGEPVKQRGGERIKAGERSKLGVVTSGSGSALKYNVYYLNDHGKIFRAEGPDSEGFWTEKEETDNKARPRSPLAVCVGSNDTLLAYTTDIEIQIIVAVNGTHRWSPLQPIKDATVNSPLTISVETAGGADKFSVFYRGTAIHNSISVATRARGTSTEVATSFSTASANSNLAAATLRPTDGTPSARLLAISSRDGSDTLFQYFRPGKRWVIPQGVIVTNTEFFK